MERQNTNPILINFSPDNSEIWTEAQLLAAKKLNNPISNNDIINIVPPTINPSDTYTDVQRLAYKYYRYIIELNSKYNIVAINITGDPIFTFSFIYLNNQLSVYDIIPCYNSVIINNTFIKFNQYPIGTDYIIKDDQANYWHERLEDILKEHNITRNEYHDYMKVKQVRITMGFIQILNI